MGTLIRLISYKYQIMFTLSNIIGYGKYIVLCLVLVITGALVGRSLKTVTVVQAAESQLARIAEDVVDCESRVLPIKAQNEKVLTDNGLSFNYSSKEAVKLPL